MSRDLVLSGRISSQVRSGQGRWGQDMRGGGGGEGHAILAFASKEFESRLFLKQFFPFVFSSSFDGIEMGREGGKGIGKGGKGGDGEKEGERENGWVVWERGRKGYDGEDTGNGGKGDEGEKEGEREGMGGLGEGKGRIRLRQVNVCLYYFFFCLFVCLSVY